MDVDSCISTYQKPGQKIFPTENIFAKTLGKYGKGLVGAARFDAKELECHLRDIVGASSHANGPDTKLDFEASRLTGEPRCKVYVELLRRYDVTPIVADTCLSVSFAQLIRTQWEDFGYEPTTLTNQVQTALTGKPLVRRLLHPRFSTLFNLESL